MSYVKINNSSDKRGDGADRKVGVVTIEQKAQTATETILLVEHEVNGEEHQKRSYTCTSEQLMRNEYQNVCRKAQGHIPTWAVEAKS